MSDPRVVKQDYHRNGIGGDGFVVSLVEWKEPETATPHFVAISFFAEDTGLTREVQAETFRAKTAVLSLDDLMVGDIENAWRGADRVGLAVVDAWVKRCAAQTTPYDPFEQEKE